jgi:hypothetical protein
MCVTTAAMVCSTFLSLLMAVGYAQVVSPSSEIKVTVVDQSGAVISDCEVVFKSVSKTIVSPTGKDGSLSIRLPGGRYTVTASHFGFLKNELPDFQVVAPAPNELKVVLKADPHYSSTPVCNPCPNVVPAIPTATSDLPSVISPEPSLVDPSAQPVTRKIRSWHCLYLWKCSKM